MHADCFVGRLGRRRCGGLLRRLGAISSSRRRRSRRGLGVRRRGVSLGLALRRRRRRSGSAELGISNGAAACRLAHAVDRRRDERLQQASDDVRAGAVKGGRLGFEVGPRARRRFEAPVLCGRNTSTDETYQPKSGMATRADSSRTTGKACASTRRVIHAHHSHTARHSHVDLAIEERDDLLLRALQTRCEQRAVPGLERRQDACARRGREADLQRGLRSRK